MTPQEFFRAYLPYARSVSEQTGLDPRLVLAQAALETGYGRSAPGYNFFGIKGSGQNQQTQEFRDGRWVTENAGFRTYSDPAGSFSDYASLMMNSPRYEPVRAGRTLEEQIAAMASSGYATDPDYGAKLSSIAGMIDYNSPELIGADTMRALGRETGAIPVTQKRTEAPMGLLNMGQPQGQPQPQPQQGGFWDRFAGGILADPDRRARLAMALEGMTLNPNQALIQAAQSGIEERRTQGQANRTIEYLRSQPGGEQFIPLVEVAGAGGALQAYLEAAKKPTFTNEQLGQAGALRDDLNKELGDFGVVRSGYENISTFYNTPNAVSDYALAVAFAKILDPGSVAREGEVAAVQNAGAKVPALGQALKNAITGEGALTEEVRYQIAQLASQIYANKAAGAEGTIGRYRSAAEMAGLPFDLIYMGGEIPTATAPTPPASAGMTQSAIDAGVTPEQWTMMTPQQRAAFP